MTPKPEEIAAMLRERAAWEIERAQALRSYAAQHERSAEALIAKAEEVEQRTGAYVGVA